MTGPDGFFRSRWVDRPEHVTELDSAGLPQGFRAAGVAAGLKDEGLDVGVLVADEPEATSAARFTASALVGAPVAISRQAALDRLRVVVASSGNANVADGERGLETARLSQLAAAEQTGIEAERIGLAATGPTARELPRQKLLDGIEAACAALGPDAGAFSDAIMTTDRSPKRACLELELASGKVTLAAQAKGAGMLAPKFATMFCFVETDAAIDAATLDLLTGVTVKRSFERASVDAQLSTSDTVFALASGSSGVRIEQQTDDELRFGNALDALLRQLAIEMVADGEGAERVGRVIVRGAGELVEPVARAVADSALVKTALNGADPNYGRILQAAGMALAGLPFYVDLSVQGKQLVSGGVGIDLDDAEWAELEQAVQAPEVEYELTVPGEGGETEVFFSDLSHGYVTLNAEYTT